MRKHTPGVSADPRPNLIPMIDIMFLLLLFFMLGADMGQREIEDVALPDARTVKEDKRSVGEGRLTINVYHASERDARCAAVEANATCRDAAHWFIGVRGVDCTTPAALRSTVQAAGGTETRVMVRADRCAPYAMVQRALSVCAAEGLYRIECGAAAPQER